MDFMVGDPLEPRVLFEDASLVAVYKPPRMHSAPGLGGGDLCAWVFERYPEAGAAGAGDGGHRASARSRAEGGLLHRLDYETSGLVLFARGAESFLELLRQQELGGFRKEYLARSSVSPGYYPVGSAPRRGVPGGVAEEEWSKAREEEDLAALAALLQGGRQLSSSFRPYGPRGSQVACLQKDESGSRKLPVYRSQVLGASLGEKSTLELKIGLSRGFRHQIRAQLAWIGLPILGDYLYGGLADERLQLYALGLSFAHPATGEAFSLSLSAP
jgi:23S rRNA pseudouridine1911/1915/1917 synthase